MATVGTGGNSGAKGASASASGVRLAKSQIVIAQSVGVQAALFVAVAALLIGAASIGGAVRTVAVSALVVALIYEVLHPSGLGALDWLDTKLKAA